MYDKLEIRYENSNKNHSPENVGKSLMKNFCKQTSFHYSTSTSEPNVTKKFVFLNHIDIFEEDKFDEFERMKYSAFFF